MKDPIMSHYNEDLPGKLIDGCILRDATNLFNALDASSKPTLANFLGVKTDELTPYHLTAIIETEAAGIMVNDLVQDYETFSGRDKCGSYAQP